MASTEKYECIFVIGREVADETYSWMISLLDYSRVKAVTIFNFAKKNVILHEAGGFHHMEDLEKKLERIDTDLLQLLLEGYLIGYRPEIYRSVFQGQTPEPLPLIGFISISSHSFVSGLSPWYSNEDGAVSYTFHLGEEPLISYRDDIRGLLSPECVIKIWGCQGIAGEQLPARARRACLQLDWDGKQGNRDFFHPELYSPPHPPEDSKKYNPPPFFKMVERNRERINESLREEFDLLTAVNILKYAFDGDNPALVTPVEKDEAGKVLNNKERVDPDYMKDYIAFPVALARFMKRSVIASRFGFSTEKHAISAEKLPTLEKIRDENRVQAFPGLGTYFDKADGEITMPVDVECPVHDLLISRWVTPKEEFLIPRVLLSLYHPSERYVVFRPDLHAGDLPLPLPAGRPEISSVLGYHGTDEDILKTGHLLTYPGIDDY